MIQFQLAKKWKYIGISVEAVIFNALSAVECRMHILN